MCVLRRCSICQSIHGDNDLLSCKEGTQRSRCLYLAQMGSIFLVRLTCMSNSKEAQLCYVNLQQDTLLNDPDMRNAAVQRICVDIT